MSRNDNETDPVIVLIGIVTLVVIGGALLLSKNIADGLGANFWVVFHSVLYTGLGLTIWIGVLWSVFHFGTIELSSIWCTLGLLLSGMAIIVWWFFGKVLDSVAIGGGGPDAVNQFSYYRDVPWWDSGLFQWGVVLILLLAIGVFGKCVLDNQ